MTSLNNEIWFSIPFELRMYIYFIRHRIMFRDVLQELSQIKTITVGVINSCSKCGKANPMGKRLYILKYSNSKIVSCFRCHYRYYSNTSSIYGLHTYIDDPYTFPLPRTSSNKSITNRKRHVPSDRYSIRNIEKEIGKAEELTLEKELEIVQKIKEVEWGCYWIYLKK